MTDDAKSPAPSNLPPHGALIVFSRVPAGSYAREGVPYRVSIHSGRVYLENVATGAGTSDDARLYAHAVWHVVTAP